MLRKGMEAPDFALPDSEGRVVKLSDFMGKNVVLYFYPKDMTPGCTKEASGFRDYHTYYTDKNIVVLGVSMDSQESHKKFAGKYGLPFALLSDPEGRVCRMYGVFQLKKLYGREYGGIRRTTFVIGPDGSILDVVEKVNVDTHHRDVLRLFDR